MKKPESIISINIEILIGISSYDAFVYEYTNIENGKKYVGSHLGTLGDGYWHSSRNLEFIDLFSGMSPIFEYKILGVGSFDEMKNLEAKIHKDNEVVSNKMYYNLAAAGSSFKVPVRQDLIKDFVLPKVLCGDFNQLEKWNKSDLLDRGPDSKITSLQVRYEDNPLIIEIRHLIKQKGDANDCSHILLVELGNGRYMIIDGNSTLLAVSTIDFVTKLRVAIIPKTFIDHYEINLDELRYLGQLMNPESEVIKTPTSANDLIKTLQSFFVESDQKIKFNSDYCLNYIYSVLKCSPQKAGSIAKKAKKDYHTNAKLKSGSKVIDYNPKRNPLNHEKVVERAEELSDKEGRVIVVHGGTGAPKTLSLKIWDAILDNPNALRFVAVIHHDTDDVYEKWESDYRDVVKNRVIKTLKSMKPLDGVIDEHGVKRDGVERTFRFEEMPHEESDIS
tara:strand:- start:2325 stop:3665 length:1341 start_codon:yes stop_codon:yes gene_type:complete